LISERVCCGPCNQNRHGLVKPDHDAGAMTHALNSAAGPRTAARCRSQASTHFGATRRVGNTLPGFNSCFASKTHSTAILKPSWLGGCRPSRTMRAHRSGRFILRGRFAAPSPFETRALLAPQVRALGSTKRPEPKTAADPGTAACPRARTCGPSRRSGAGLGRPCRGLRGAFRRRRI
jgi:hypothetical protein